MGTLAALTLAAALAAQPSCGGRANPGGSGSAPGAAGPGSAREPEGNCTDDPGSVDCAGAQPNDVVRCIENPYVVGCVGPHPNGTVPCIENPYVVGCVGPYPEDLLPPSESEPTAREVADIVRERCGPCHGEEPSCDDCDFIRLDSIEFMITVGWITPCDWESSQLARLFSPWRNGHEAAAEDLERMGRFVNGLCSNLTEGGPTDDDRLFTEALLNERCGECHGTEGNPEPVPIDDIGALLEGGYVRPCTEESGILWILRVGHDPVPVNPFSWPSEDEIARVRSFILRPCEP